jgi:hypothetical protein
MMTEMILGLGEAWWDIDIPWFYECVFRIILYSLILITLPLDILLMPIELIIYKIIMRIK